MTEHASGPSRECGPTCLHTCTVQPTAYSADSVECLFKNMELYSFLREEGVVVVVQYKCWQVVW
jgi:hypothetical protein